MNQTEGTGSRPAPTMNQTGPPSIHIHANARTHLGQTVKGEERGEPLTYIAAALFCQAAGALRRMLDNTVSPLIYNSDTVTDDTLSLTCRDGCQTSQPSSLTALSLTAKDRDCNSLAECLTEYTLSNAKVSC